MKHYVGYYLALFVVLISGQAASAKHRKHRSKHAAQSRVLGGSNTTIQSYPNDVVITAVYSDNKKLRYQCSGSIIREDFVLTSAYCVEGVDNATIRVGSAERDSGGQTYDSEDFRIHPFFDSNRGYFDVALIKIKDGIKIDNKTTKVIKISRNGEGVKEGQNLTISGWGRHDLDDGGYGSNFLMEATITALSKKNCEEQVGKKIKGQFCAGDEERGSCKGDYGDPVIDENGVQRGMASYLQNCYADVGLYTDIGSSYIRGFIKGEFERDDM